MVKVREYLARQMKMNSRNPGVHFESTPAGRKKMAHFIDKDQSSPLDEARCKFSFADR